MPARLRSVRRLLLIISKRCPSFDKISYGRATSAATTRRRSQREQLPQLPFLREANFQNTQTACASVKHSRKSSHYFILWPVSATGITISTIVQLALDSAGASCLELGTSAPWFWIWLHLNFPLPSNRIDSLKIATALEGLEKDDPIPACPAPILPPARPCARPSNRPTLSLTSTGNRALLGTEVRAHRMCPRFVSWFTISQLTQPSLSAI